MPVLNIEGRRVRVEDAFLSMPPEQQQAEVEDIARQIGIGAKASEQPDNQPSQAYTDTANELSAITQNPAKAQYDAMPGWQKPLVAASDIVDRFGNGLMLNMGDEIAAGIRAPFTDKSYAEELDEMERQSNAARARSGLAGVTADLAGGLATVGGAAKRGLSLGTNAAKAGHGLGRVATGSAVDSAVLAGMMGAGTEGTLEDRADTAFHDAKWGLGFGVAAPFAIAAGSKLVQKAISPFAASPERTAAANVLQREGIDITAGQKTGSKGLRYAESEIGGNAAENILERQGEQFTAAALHRAGVDASRATPEVIDDAFNRIGGQFDGLAARNTLIPDRQLAKDTLDAYSGYNRMVAESQRIPAVKDMANDVVKAIKKGPISGEVYQPLRSRLETLARKTRDSDAAAAFRELKDGLDDAMERSIAKNNPADAGAWRDVRNQYRNMLVVEKASTGAGENAALGLISPSQLRNATVQQGRRDYARGKGDFAELARAGEAILKPLPQSGTAPRLHAHNLGAMAPSIVGAGAGGAYGAQDGGGFQGALIGALAGAVAPKAIGRLMMSKPGQRYLANQLLLSGPLTPEKRALVTRVLNYSGVSAIPSLTGPR